MTDEDRSGAESEEIYNLAKESVELFEKLKKQLIASQVGSGLRVSPKLIEEYEQRFWAWATGLGVFAEPNWSLDAKLASHPEIQELVLLLLDVLKTNLNQAVNGGDNIDVPGVAHDTGSSADALDATVSPGRLSPKTEDKFILHHDITKPEIRQQEIHGERAINDHGIKSVERLSERDQAIDIAEELYGIKEAIIRLQRLSVTLRKASKSGLFRRIQRYAKRQDEANFGEITGHILKYMFPRLDGGLAEQLRMSIVYRRNRLLYHQSHRQKILRHRDMQSAPLQLTTERVTLPPVTSDVAPKKTPLYAIERRVSKSYLESRSGRSTLDKDFNLGNYKSSPPASEISGSSEPWTGRINYPKAPEAEPGTSHVLCPICLEMYEEAKFESQRAWRRHVNEDLEPYVCISEDCDNPFSYFVNSRLWRDHMREVHTENWLQLLHKPTKWVCTIAHANPLIFHSGEELSKHVQGSHEEYITNVGIDSIGDFVESGEIRISRSPSVCPICQAHVDHFLEDTTKLTKSTISTSANPEPSAITAKLSRHVAGHLKMLAFRSLRGFFSDADQEAQSQDSQGRNNASVSGSQGGTDLDNVSLSSYDILPEDRILTDVRPGAKGEDYLVREEHVDEKKNREYCLHNEPQRRDAPEWYFVQQHSSQFEGRPDSTLEKFQKKYLMSHINQHWIVPRSANTMFIGRDLVLHELETIVRDAVKNPSPQDRCCIVICGMGGQGKSEICLQLALRVRQLFWGVFWVDASTADSVESAFLHIASQLHIPVQTWEDARRGLAKIQQSWFLVLDNADDPHVDYQHYIPAGPSSIVMLTSRNKELSWYGTQKCITVGELSDTEAQELLLRAAHIPRRQEQTLKKDAQVIAALLQWHPLALIQAGSYVSRGHCTLAEYPNIFSQQRRRLLAFQPNQAKSRYGNIYATFEASAQIIELSHTESAGDALQLLQLLAICSPSRLPMPLFEAVWKGAQTISSSKASDVELMRLTPWHVAHLLPLIQAENPTWDSFRLTEAINLLKMTSLVSSDTYSGFLSISMHPLTHAWAQDRQDKAKQHESWVMTGCLVALSRNDYDLWQQHGRQLQPHIQALTSWEISSLFVSEPLEGITCILVNCGWLLYNMRCDAKLFILMNSLFTYLGLDRQIVDRRWLVVYELNARNLINYGKTTEAVSLLKQVVKIEEQTLADDHPDRLTSQQVLAVAYQANGQVKEAVSLLEYVVRIHEQTLAEDHPDRLASQKALAVAYQANGQVKEAVSLLEHVVRIHEQTLAEDHPDRLASQKALAVTYQANGQIKEAVLLLEHVVRIQELTLVEDHPDRLALQKALAIAYRENGQVNEAESLLEQVVKIQEQTLAEDHPDRLASQHELAVACRENGQVKEAVSLLEQVVKIQEQTLAEDHPDRLASQRELAVACRENGQVNKGVSLLEQVVKIQEQTLAEDHPDRLASQRELAAVYRENGQVKEAVSLLEQVVRIQEQMLAENHPSRLASQHALAVVYRENGQVNKGVSLLEHVVKIEEQTLAEDHPSRLASQHALATIYWDFGRHNAALQMMKHVVEIQRQVLDEHHPSRVNSEDWLKYFEKEQYSTKPV